MTMRSLLAIARVTFLELMRDKILYSVLAVAILLFGAGYLASELTQFLRDRLLIDFGVAAVTLCAALIGVLTGAGLLPREFERKTHMIALSRPVSTLTFVSGKFLGLAGILILNTVLLSVVLFASLMFTEQGPWSTVVACAIAFAGMQSLMLASLALLVSSFSTTSVAVMVSIALYLVGMNLSSLSALAQKSQGPPLTMLLRLLSIALPNFEFFSLGTRVTYRLPLSTELVITALGYGLAWVVFAILIAGKLVQGRDRS